MKYLYAILILILPSFILRFISKLFKHKRFNLTGGGIGFSLVLSNSIALTNNSRIGHFNIIRCKDIAMNHSSIGHLNFIKGCFSVIMENKSWIRNQNKISATIGSSYKDVNLILMEGAAIGVGHLLDMTDDITIGKYSMLAGCDTQIWTHSFYFSKNSCKYARVDAPVVIGDHCYIGARCTINSGVTISDAITIGSATCVSKSLKEQGLYVSQGLRFIQFDPDEKIHNLGEPVKFSHIYRRNKC